MESERVRPYPLLVEPLRMLPLVLISLFLAVGAVDLLLAVQPAILQSLRAYWHGAAGGGTASSALAAASLIVGGVALAATLLAAFIRGVRSAPYLCITPVWVCTCMLAIARLPIELPLPVPMSAFVAISALLFVGSGVLFETPARLPNLIGTAASLLPLTLLSIGYALHPQARASFGGDTILMFFVLALAAAGAPAIAIACRGASSRAFTAQPSDGREPTGTHIVELLERARLSEERAERAERQLASVPSWQQAGAPRLAVGDEDSALLRSRGAGGSYGWAAAGIVLAIAIGGYLFVHAPLRARLATQARLAQEQIDKQATALASLRADLVRQRADLEQQLAAAAPAAGPAAAPAPNEPPARTVKTLAAPHESESHADASDASAEREARAQARLARREEAAAARADRAAEREARATAAREARETERTARAAEREARAAERATRASEKPARKAVPVADDDADAEDAAEAKHAAPPPAPAAKPKKELDSDDPLEGLDGM